MKDTDYVTEIINDNNLSPLDYSTLLDIIESTDIFMEKLRSRLREPFSEDMDSLYSEIEFLIISRDYLATHSSMATSLYRASRGKFIPMLKGSAIEKEGIRDMLSSPYKFYANALEERIKTLDNRCTAGKQQQRIMYEAMRKNLISEGS